MKRIDHARGHLTRLEQSLLDFVNGNPEKVVLLSQKDFLSRARVSKPILISLFRKLGYSDYRSFQAGVEQFFSTHIDSFRASRDLHERVRTIPELIDQAVHVDAQALGRLLATVPEETLRVFAEKARAARTVYVAGMGTGYYPAHYLAQRLRRYRIVTVLVSRDSGHSPDELFPLSSEDLLVAFGYTQDDSWLFPLLRFCRDRRAPSFLVTATIHPDYVGSCSYHVHVPRGEVRFKNSMAVPMAFANMLLLAFEVVHGDCAEEELQLLEETRRSWVGKKRQGGDDE